MRISLALTAALALLVPTGSAFAVGESDILRDDGSIRYRFYVDAELLFIDRSDTPDVTTSYNSFPVLHEVMSTDDVQSGDWEPGGRGTLGYRINETQAVELTLMGWGHDRSKAKASPNAENLYAFEAPDATSFSDSTFDAAAVHDLSYDSTFYSGELNYRHRLEVEGAEYHFNLLAGLRALRLEENLGLKSFDEVFPTSPPPADAIGKYDIHTRNTLIGAQIGAETFVPLIDDRLDFDLYFTAGGYANQAKVFTDYRNGTDTPIRLSRSAWGSSAVLDAAASFEIKVYRGVQLKLGYRALYLVNIASAPDQFARSGSARDFFGRSYNNKDDTLFHGPSVGLSVDF